MIATVFVPFWGTSEINRKSPVIPGFEVEKSANQFRDTDSDLPPESSTPTSVIGGITPLLPLLIVRRSAVMACTSPPTVH